MKPKLLQTKYNCYKYITQKTGKRVCEHNLKGKLHVCQTYFLHAAMCAMHSTDNTILFSFFIIVYV